MTSAAITAAVGGLFVREGPVPFLLVVIILLMFRPVRFIAGWGITAFIIYMIFAANGAFQ